jgi:hypothetical protein
MIAPFVAALRELGIECDVEKQGRLAIITTDPEFILSVREGPPLRMTSERRRAIVSLARAHGFKNVCVELRSDAPVPGD